MSTTWSSFSAYEATDAQFIEPGTDYLTVRPDENDSRKRDKSAKAILFQCGDSPETVRAQASRDPETDDDIVTDTLPKLKKTLMTFPRNNRMV